MTGVRVEGLDELRRTLRAFDRKSTRLIGHANKKVARTVVDKVQPKVPTRVAGRRGLRRGVTASGTQRAARVVIKSTARRPTVAAVLGANVHPVFGRRTPRRAMRRFPWEPHLGAKWKPTDLYGVGPMFEDLASDEIQDEFFEAVVEALDGWFRKG